MPLFAVLVALSAVAAQSDTPEIKPDCLSLPPNYSGADASALVASYEKKVPIAPDKFETTADFQKRQEGALQKVGVGRLTLKTYWAFSPVAQSPDYDADASEVVVRIRERPLAGEQTSFKPASGPNGGLHLFDLQATITKSEKVEEENGLGNKFEVLRSFGNCITLWLQEEYVASLDQRNLTVDRTSDGSPRGLEIHFPMSVAEAKNELDRLRVVFVGRFVANDDPISELPDDKLATTDDRFETHWLIERLRFTVESLIVYDKPSGKVIFRRPVHNYANG